MLYNYIKIAFRHLTRNSVYSFINVAGLAVGIACAILIFLWVANEISYNRFHANYDRIYQLEMNQEFADGVSTQASMPYVLKDVLKEKSSKIKRVTLTNWGEENLLTAGEKSLTKKGLSVSEEFLQIFQFELLAGDRANALNDPNSIVISQSTAKAFFGERDPINQFIKVDNGKDLKVTGIFKDIPFNSTLEFDYLLPFAFYESTQSWIKYVKDNWQAYSFQMYVELEENQSETAVNEAIKTIIADRNPEAKKTMLFLYPMSDWRLYSTFENGKAAGGIIEYVKLFSAIAVLILVIACINFMNLATARSEGRAREVGVRKSVGSRRKDLIFQFLGESIFISFISFVLAVGLVELSLPLYNVLIGKNLSIDYTNSSIIFGGIALVVLTGFIAGSYPAFYLSSFQPSKVLKGKPSAGKKGSTPRKVMVTLQFGFSIFLIIGTFVIYQQIIHVKNRQVGYDRENLLLVWTTGDIEKNFKTLREELVNTEEVKSMCKSNSPVTAVFSTNTAEWRGMDPNTKVSFSTIATEYDYTETLGIKMLQGRDFSRDFVSDSNAMVINQAALDIMGLQNPIGEEVKMNNSFHIIGVMENVIMTDPSKAVEPLVMIFSPTWSSTISVRMNKTNDFQKSIAAIEKVFKKYSPAFPFEYRFADQEFDKKFASINLISRLASLFAILAIIITCLGLFGLAAFTAEQRSKEVGIRKVMGASVTNLVLMISKDFSRLVIFAFIISAPFAWWALNNFLEQYPYRVKIQWWILPLAGMFALVLALIIVSTQAFKAASGDPIKSLRSE
jgi:putative ABC transport system permease protein